MKYSISLLFLIFIIQLTKSQDVVDINLDVKHSVNGVSELDRSKYMMIHASSTDGEWPSETVRQQFHEDYDVYLGRNNGSMPWHLSQCQQDPSKPGWPSVTHLQQLGAKAKTNYINAPKHHKYESRRAAYMMGGQEGMYPNGEHQFGPNNGKWTMAKDGYKPLAEYFANYLKYFHGTGGANGEPKPTYFEVMNEPFVKATKLGTTRENLSEMHKVVARRVKELNPDVKVGGYSAAHPAYEAANFRHWESNWKTFIDIAGADMDYFSLHLYDNFQGASGSGQYRSGSNIEAILDMVEHYSYLKLGEVKPFCISEMGSLIPSTGTPYTRERDWHNLRSFSTITMQLMEKQDLIAQSLPFLLVKANWWKDPDDPSIKYAFRLFRQKKELAGETGDDWVYTDLVKFYQLWSNVKGTRVDTKSSNPDMQTDTYVHGNKAYVILNNMHHEARTIDLYLKGTGDAKIESVFIKHVYAAENNWLPTLDESNLSKAPKQVNIGREATMILEYTFDKAIQMPESVYEKKYYASTYFKPIVANQAIDFNIDGVTLAEQGEVILRLGVGRDHNYSLQPQLLFNDSFVVVPENFRGDDQKTRDRFFGVLEIPVPFKFLNDSNTISVTFPDANGHVSSVSMQVFNFSKPIIRTGGEILEVKLSEDSRQMKPGKKFQLFASILPANFENKNISWESSNQSIVSVTNNGLIEAMAIGTADIIVTTEVDQLKDTCKIEVSTTAPDILAETIQISPRSAAILMNDTKSLSVEMTPLDVDILNANWVSRDTFIANVDAQGLVTAKNLGSTYIIAKTLDGSDIRDSIKVNITPLPNSVDCSLFPKSMETDSILEFDVNYTLGDTMDIAVEVTKSGAIMPWIAEGQVTVLPGSGTVHVEVKVVDKVTGKSVIPVRTKYLAFARVRKVGGDASTNTRNCLNPVTLLERTPDGINTVLKDGINVFPNPASTHIEIKGFTSPSDRVFIYSMQGVESQRHKMNAQQIFDVSTLAKGTYLLKVIGKNKIKTSVFVKE